MVWRPGSATQAWAEVGTTHAEMVTMRVLAWVGCQMVLQKMSTVSPSKVAWDCAGGVGEWIKS